MADVAKFGEFPFDQYTIVGFVSYCPLRFPLLPDSSFKAKWDPASPHPKAKQKRVLFEKWLALGDWGRRVGFLLGSFHTPTINSLEAESIHELQEYMIDPANPVEIPAYIPRDLQPPEERKHSEPMQSLAWIRTWFGGSGNKACE
ncbi:hypothetical protein BJY04DRAFT_222934 [Aspergillus karnatakaensis]|uniref:uncharacterized protein n=1 Tax=Aspergillus karnatakaensis TaxID=1810916 RepID=UPI003CCE32BB